MSELDENFRGRVEAVVAQIPSGRVMTWAAGGVVWKCAGGTDKWAA